MQITPERLLAVSKEMALELYLNKLELARLAARVAELEATASENNEEG